MSVPSGKLPIVGPAEAKAGDRSGEEDQHDARPDQPAERVALDGAAPPVGEGRFHRLRTPSRDGAPQRPHGQAGEQGEEGERTGGGRERRQPDAEAEQGDRREAGGDEAAPAGELDPLPGEPEQRREQRGGREHGGEHGGGDTDAHAADRPDAHEEEAEHRDHHGGAGEDHGSPGGLHGDHGGRTRRVPGVEAFPVAGDDEEGVVDADAEPDHDPEDGGVVRDGEDVAEEQGDPDAGGDTAECDGDREAHGEHRPEGQDQDDHGEGEAEELGLRGVDHGQVLAAREDLEAVDRGACSLIALPSRPDSVSSTSDDKFTWA
ncbi:MAG: hypothetical protein V9G12_16890 [Microthrixaceae bacterium]